MIKPLVLQVPLTIELKAAFDSIALRNDSHARDYLRSLVKFLASRAKVKPEAFQENKLLTRKHKLTPADTTLIFSANSEVAQYLNDLSTVLGCGTTTTVMNIIEFVVSTEERRRAKP